MSVACFEDLINRLSDEERETLKLRLERKLKLIVKILIRARYRSNKNTPIVVYRIITHLARRVLNEDHPVTKIDLLPDLFVRLWDRCRSGPILKGFCYGKALSPKSACFAY
jgi:hypothetical protein